MPPDISEILMMVIDAADLRCAIILKYHQRPKILPINVAYLTVFDMVDGTLKPQLARESSWGDMISSLDM